MENKPGGPAEKSSGPDLEKAKNSPQPENAAAVSPQATAGSTAVADSTVAPVAAAAPKFQLSHQNQCQKKM